MASSAAILKTKSLEIEPHFTTFYTPFWIKDLSLRDGHIDVAGGGAVTDPDADGRH